jgi:hypothetical protein
MPTPDPVTLDISDWPDEWQPHWPPGTNYDASLNTITITTENDTQRVADLARPHQLVKTTRGYAECVHATLYFHGTDPPILEVKWLPRVVRSAFWPVDHPPA